MELGTEDLVEFNVAFGRHCEELYTRPRQKHHGMVKAVWISWDERFIPDRRGGENHDYRRWECLGHNLSLDTYYDFRRRRGGPPKVALTMFYQPREHAAHMATMDDNTKRFHPTDGGKFATFKGNKKDDVINGAANVIEADNNMWQILKNAPDTCLLYTSPSPRDVEEARMPSSA